MSVCGEIEQCQRSIHRYMAILTSKESKEVKDKVHKLYMEEKDRLTRLQRVGSLSDD